jgi:ferritin-like protein
MANYVITDGTRWIMKDRNGKYVPTSCESFADIFSKKQAENIYKSSLTKALRGVFHVEKTSEEVSAQVKPVTDKDIEETGKVMVSEDIKYWLDKATDMSNIANEAINRKRKLCQELSLVDKELCDILHYIEFCNLNAAQGYKAYKMVKERRILRRKIKDEISILDSILDQKVSQTTKNTTQKTAENMDKRTYEPRVLKELFDF